MIMIVEPFTPQRPQGSWVVECSICRWRRESYRDRWHARHAAAQHLWQKRRQPQHQPKPAKLGQPALCPTPGKKRHPDEAAAVEHIRQLYKGGKGNPDYCAYRCPCGCWHIGHSRVHFTRRIRAVTRRRGRSR